MITLRLVAGTFTEFDGERWGYDGGDPNENWKVVKSAGIVVIRGNSMLTITRGKNAFEFPKGRIEWGETYAMTAQREFIEETGCVNIEDLQVNWQATFVQEYDYIRKGRQTKKKVYLFFGVENPGREMQFGKRERQTLSLQWSSLWDVEKKYPGVSRAANLACEALKF